MTYKEYINELRQTWTGRKVIYDGNAYTVTDVDYNGQLLIDKPAQYTSTTAVSITQIEIA